jgi:HEAT repeat protein
VEGLIKALQSDGALEVRLSASVALGRVGGDRAKEALSYYAGHAELPEVRLSARNVLDEFSKEPPITPKPPPPPEGEKQ